MRTLQSVGIVFITETNGEPGVRLRKAASGEIAQPSNSGG